MHVIIVVSFLSACDALDFDEVDFDEPMELGAEQQEEPAVRAEAEPEAEPGVKVEPKTEPEDEVLMCVFLRGFVSACVRACVRARCRLTRLSFPPQIGRGGRLLLGKDGGGRG